MLRRVLYFFAVIVGWFVCTRLVERLTGVSPPPTTILLFAPLLGWSGSRVVFEILHAIERHAHATVFEPWNGRYYTFDERQLRFYLVNDTVWTPVEDLERILEPPPGERELRLLGADHAAIPNSTIMACSEAGLLRLLAARTAHRRASYHMIRFRNWIEKQAFPNVKRLPSSATGLIRVDETPTP